MVDLFLKGVNMKIIFHVPRRITGAYPYPIWPKDWPVPPIGSSIYTAPGQPPLKVTAVDFFPSGEDVGDEPSIYVVLSELH